MVSDKDLKRIIDKAKSDPVFFDDLFADPKKALANAGLDRSVVTAKDDDCWGITCSWTCSWTGSVQRGVERGALSAADCGGITCSWTCSWTGFRQEIDKGRPVRSA